MTWSCKAKDSVKYELKPVLLPPSTKIPMTSPAQPVEESTMEPSYYQSPQTQITESVGTFQQDQSIEKCDVSTVDRAFQLLESKFSKQNLTLAVQNYGLCNTVKLPNNNITKGNSTGANHHEPVTVKTPSAKQPVKPPSIKQPVTVKPPAVKQPVTVKTPLAKQPVTVKSTNNSADSEAVAQENNYFPAPETPRQTPKPLPALSPFFQDLLKKTGISNGKLRSELLAHCSMLKNRIKRAISYVGAKSEDNGYWVLSLCWNTDFFLYCFATAMMIQAIEIFIIGPIKCVGKKTINLLKYFPYGHQYQETPISD